jgi:hypothetical protein
MSEADMTGRDGADIAYEFIQEFVLLCQKYDVKITPVRPTDRIKPYWLERDRENGFLLELGDLQDLVAQKSGE